MLLNRSKGDGVKVLQTPPKNILWLNFTLKSSFVVLFIIRRK